MRRPRTFEIIPHEGAPPLMLGMHRTDILGLLGEPRKTKRNYEYFYDNGLQIEHKRGQVVFIQFSRGAGLTVRYHGIELFELTVKETLDLMSAEAPYDKNDPLLGRSYFFRQLDVMFWRENQSESHFDTVAVAVKGYWK